MHYCSWALLYCYFDLFLFPDLNFITIFILASGHSHGSWLILLLGMLGSFSAFAFLFILFSKSPCIDSKLTGAEGAGGQRNTGKVGWGVLRKTGRTVFSAHLPPVDLSSSAKAVGKQRINELPGILKRIFFFFFSPDLNSIVFKSDLCTVCHHSRYSIYKKKTFWGKISICL